MGKSSFLAEYQIEELKWFAYLADRMVRSDLAIGMIAGENDYTSNFTGVLRRLINTKSRTRLRAKSFVNPPSQERVTGTDAAIVLTTEKSCKVALFEAKLPRFSKNRSNWDHWQTAKGQSHFSDQIIRQARFNRQFAIFEMFYCEENAGLAPYSMLSEGSTCVWSKDADAYRKANKKDENLWKNEDLPSLFSYGEGAMTLSSVIEKFARCQEGRPFPFQFESPRDFADKFRFQNEKEHNIVTEDDEILPSEILKVSTHTENIEESNLVARMVAGRERLKKEGKGF